LATYTVRRSKHATLVATTVDTVKFSTKPKTVEVRNLDATAVILFRSDGEVPAVNGDDTERLGPDERLEVDAAKQLGSLPRLNAGNYVESNTSGSDGHRVIYGFTLVGTEVEIAWRAGTSSETSGYGATQICRASGRTTRFVAPSLRHTTYCQMRLTTDDLLECLG
jgi:hypothetical protein